jgi:hypothetical protein
MGSAGVLDPESQITALSGGLKGKFLLRSFWASH